MGAATSRQGGLRAALAAKRRHTVPHDIRVVDDAVADAADHELDQARMAHASAQHAVEAAARRGADQEAPAAALTAARERLERAQATRDGCYERLTVASIAPADFEALKADHPASDKDKAQGVRFDVEAIRPALFAACITGADGEQLDEEEWAEEITSGRWPAGELEQLALKAHVVNNTAPGYSSPKASDGTPSWPPAWLTAGPAASR